MVIRDLLALLGPEIEDLDEETFLLFSHDRPSQSLGFVDSKAQSLTVTVSGRDFTIHQSPGILSSSRKGGTTGAVLWKITPRLATFLTTPSPLTTTLLTRDTTILELGCGTSALTALSLAPRIARYVLTDQAYVSKLVALNLAENQQSSSSSSSSSSHQKKRRHRGPSSPPPPPSSNITFAPLDWETDSPTRDLTGGVSPDVVLACDCIYNEALIGPFVQTCVEACRLRSREEEEKEGPCVCVVAQQLRDPLVFEAWLAAFGQVFRAWRVPDEMVNEELRPEAGFVIHLGVLKEAEV